MSYFKNVSLKYPLFLFLFLLLAKTGYVVIESYYNYHVLSVTTSPSLTKATLEELNANGHRISALGITLLLIPFLFLLFKRLPAKKMLLFLSTSSVVVYILAYNSLNVIVEKIVEHNKEKRYEAYYINVFKYGVLNNLFTYNAFINNQKIEEGTLNVNDRILLTNSFLLLHADKKLIEKLKARGKEKVADLHIERNLREDYDKKFLQFEKAADEVSVLWNNLNKNKVELKHNLRHIDDSEIQPTYEKFTRNLQKKYKEYKKAWLKVEYRIAYETKHETLVPIQRDLLRYFKYRGIERAEKKYKEAMLERFDRYIEPMEWVDKNANVSFDQIKFVISREITRKAQPKINNLPRGLSLKDFLHHEEVKLLVMQDLKKSDILIPFEFDYSFSQFEKYFKVMSSKKYEEASTIFYTKLEKEIGENDITLDMTWHDFIYSDFIRSKIKNKFDTKSQKNVDNILLALESKDLSNFKKLVYMPAVQSQINEMMYTKEDFKTNPKASHHGDEAIKLLYVPPFALAVSIIALILNMYTVISMLMNAINISKKRILITKTILIVMIVFLPVLGGSKNLNNELIQSSTSSDTQTYLNFLRWISFYEKLNISFHE